MITIQNRIPVMLRVEREGGRGAGENVRRKKFFSLTCSAIVLSIFTH